MRLTSRSIEEGSRMPAAQSYAGGNRSPELSWRDPPEGTRSFAVTCYDPDAPTGSGWWHWCVLNLPAALRSLPEGASPEDLEALGAITLRNDYGTISDLAHEEAEPIYITKNGEGDLVVMSIEAFEQREETLKLRIKLEAAEASRLSDAPSYTLEESRKRLEAIYQRG